MEDVSSVGSWECVSTGNDTLCSEEWEKVSDEELMNSDAVVVMDDDHSVISLGSDEGKRWLEVVKRDTDRMTRQLQQLEEEPLAEEEEIAPDSPTEKAEDDDEWRIETITQRKRSNGVLSYKIIWKSYPSTWETEEWLEENDFGDWVEAFENGKLNRRATPPPVHQLSQLNAAESGLKYCSPIPDNRNFSPERVWPDFGHRITEAIHTALAKKEVVAIRNIVGIASSKKFKAVCESMDTSEWGVVMLFGYADGSSMNVRMRNSVPRVRPYVPAWGRAHDVAHEMFVFAGVMHHETLALRTLIPCFVVTLRDSGASSERTFTPLYYSGTAAQPVTAEKSNKSRPDDPSPGVDLAKVPVCHRGVLREALAKRHTNKEVRSYPFWLKQFAVKGLLRERKQDRSKEAMKHRTSHQPRAVTAH